MEKQSVSSKKYSKVKLSKTYKIISSAWVLSKKIIGKHRVGRNIIENSENLRKKVKAMIIAHGRKVVLDYPFALHNIELTNKCPMLCIMCPRTNHMTREQGLMNFDLFKNIIDELVLKNPDYASKFGVYLHHFGESLMHPEFGKFIRYAVQRNVYTALSLNPIMLKEDVAVELIKSQPARLFLALDGHDDESFYKIRGVKNAYQPSRKNLLRFLELKNQLNGKSKVILSMVAFPMNKDSMEKTRLYWESLEGIDVFFMKYAINWNGSASEVNELISNRDTKTSDNTKKIWCNKPWETMTVTWDGTVVPCSNDYDAKFVLGNVNQQTLSEIWNGDRMQMLRREFIKGNVTNELCFTCESLSPKCWTSEDPS